MLQGFTLFKVHKVGRDTGKLFKKNKLMLFTTAKTFFIIMLGQWQGLDHSPEHTANECGD